MSSPNSTTPDGFTESERYLNWLAKQSFLSLWCYPNLFTDKGGSKELCDLLVVFGNHVLIFSDKYCEFPDTGDLDVDWSRWYKKAILKSAQQIWGAERRIKDNPDKIYLDAECQKPLPIPLPKKEKMIIHRIAVAHGASTRCKSHFGSSGSLIIDTKVSGREHTKGIKDGGKPLHVGHIEKFKGFVHVLNDSNLDIVLQTLDTISDFIRYLDKKEKFFASYSVLAASEEDLLACYLDYTDEKGEHGFNVPLKTTPNSIFIDEGFWEEFQNSPRRKAMISANLISYEWDKLIEDFATNLDIVEQVQVPTDNVEANIEKILRFMAAEPRTERRGMAQKLEEVLRTTPEYIRRTLLFKSSTYSSPVYVFLLLPRSIADSDEDYVRIRRKSLTICCYISKLHFPEARDVVGIATETGINSFGSTDIMYYDLSEWSDADEREAKRLQNETSLLVEAHKSEIKTYEFPNYPKYGRNQDSKPHKPSRNAPCPCGSGKKYKQCCYRKSS